MILAILDDIVLLKGFLLLKVVPYKDLGIEPHSAHPMSVFT